MNLTPQDLSREVASTGFRGESLEKVFRLMALLDALNSHPFLKARIVLKGGTALNLFHFDVPRLSVDIDLNYIGAAHRGAMLAERPKLEQAVQAVCSRADLTIKRMPSEHAGGKWRLTYVAANGGSGNLELDVNFMLRTPLWAPKIAQCFAVGSFKAAPVPVLDPHELAAGKLAALLARSANRDIFDSHRLLGPRISTLRGFASGSSSTVE
jgi:predicted nucleotidyltransferase component of viral defense system